MRLIVGSQASLSWNVKRGYQQGARKERKEGGRTRACAVEEDERRTAGNGRAGYVAVSYEGERLSRPARNKVVADGRGSEF